MPVRVRRSFARDDPRREAGDLAVASAQAADKLAWERRNRTLGHLQLEMPTMENYPVVCSECHCMPWLECAELPLSVLRLSAVCCVSEPEWEPGQFVLHGTPYQNLGNIMRAGSLNPSNLSDSGEEDAAGHSRRGLAVFAAGSAYGEMAHFASAMTASPSWPMDDRLSKEDRHVPHSPRRGDVGLWL